MSLKVASCRLRWVSRRSGFCNRSSLIEPSWGANLLLYLRFDDVTGGATGSVLCLLPPPVFSHKMAPSPLKMVDCENKMAAAPWFPWDSTTGLAVSCAAKGWCWAWILQGEDSQTTPASPERCPHRFFRYAIFRFCHRYNGLGSLSCLARKPATSVLPWHPRPGTPRIYIYHWSLPPSPLATYRSGLGPGKSIWTPPPGRR